MKRFFMFILCAQAYSAQAANFGVLNAAVSKLEKNVNTLISKYREQNQSLRELEKEYYEKEQNIIKKLRTFANYVGYEFNYEDNNVLIESFIEELDSRYKTDLEKIKNLVYSLSGDDSGETNMNILLSDISNKIEQYKKEIEKKDEILKSCLTYLEKFADLLIEFNTDDKADSWMLSEYKYNNIVEISNELLKKESLDQNNSYGQKMKDFLEKTVPIASQIHEKLKEKNSNVQQLQSQEQHYQEALQQQQYQLQQAQEEIVALQQQLQSQEQHYQQQYQEALQQAQEERVALQQQQQQQQQAQKEIDALKQQLKNYRDDEAIIEGSFLRKRQRVN